RLTRSTGLGARRLYRDHVTGELNEETALPPGASTEGLHGDRTALVRLSREDADALGRELVETFDRYAARRLPEGQGQTYLVQIALLPVSPEDEP
ncbi:hypothetical protein, partial [Deinococcus pimensis]|uniref:hypothetical protein n=1 Tax=Deinococcus pimensis TaxID=309888 RepID=UPI0005EB56E5